MMWLAQGRARHARCRDRPIAARVSASAARKDHTFGQTAMLSTAIRGKAKRQYDVAAELGGISISCNQWCVRCLLRFRQFRPIVMARAHLPASES